MSFGGLILTNEGRNKIAASISNENPLKFAYIQLGDGMYNGSYLSKKELTNTVMQIPITRVSRYNNEVLIECDWNDKQAPYGFYLREVGIYGNDALCYYDNAGFGDAEYIDPDSDMITKEKRFRFTVIISEEVNVTTRTLSGLYALKQDVEDIDNAKVDKEPGKGLSEQNFTTELLNKLNNIEESANNYTHPDSGVTEGTKGTNNNKNINLDFGSKFVVPGFNVDEKGHITSANEHDVILPNKPTYTKKDVGLGNIDNTSDLDKPVSIPVQEALDTYYAQLTAYTNKAINDLINGAPTTLDTLKELADAIKANQDVQEALDAAIGTKANENEFKSHVSTIANKTVAGHVKVDDVLSSTSTNPAQNKVVKEALDNKQPSLGFTPVRQGGGTGQTNNKIYIGWSNENKLKAQVDNVDMGGIVTTGANNNVILPVSKGGTGATSADAARSNLGIGNVENKSSSTIRSELTKKNIIDALGYRPPSTDTIDMITEGLQTHYEYIEIGNQVGNAIQYVYGEKTQFLYGVTTGVTDENGKLHIAFKKGENFENFQHPPIIIASATFVNSDRTNVCTGDVTTDGFTAWFSDSNGVRKNTKERISYIAICVCDTD